MAAFDRIKSGVPQIDAVLDSIRLGDNVVWQVSDVSEFRFFAEKFAAQAVKDGRTVNYVRFAQHERVLEPGPGIETIEMDPDAGFETFTVNIHNLITEKGPEAFYVFDCLSELQSVWYTDLMMGNFFRVTCPYLFQLDTVAYFPLIKGRHSFDAVSVIRDTTQLLLDAFAEGEDLYVHPLKVWNRNSPQMFLPHKYNMRTGDFAAVEDGVEMSRYYAARQRISDDSEDQNADSYDRFFNTAKMMFATGVFTEEVEEQIISSTMTKDARLKGLVKKYFRPRDYFALRDRMIGSGAIGGKACGMLLARRIAETELPEFAKYNEPHDSFYIGSDVFYTYIVSNKDWDLRIAQRTEEGFFAKAGELKTALLMGTFPDKIKERFVDVLEYFGQSPFIVRSSSFLEDGFGNAFAGKYKSVFCVNQGSPEERLDAFEQAVRAVYASTMDNSALEYRRQRGLDKSDEQMAILVQRVSGTYFGRYFMPCAAGVGYSHSAYKMFADMDPSAGMLRLVMGLGTKAVDRTKEDYPRLSNLDKPTVTTSTSIEQKHRFSQRYADVLDCVSNSFKEIPVGKLSESLPFWYKIMVYEHDTEAERTISERGLRRDVIFASCQGLVETKAFTGIMKKLLKTLETVYENPVDIEYTVNINEKRDFVINLLQCRPLYQQHEGEKIDMSAVKPARTFFDIKDSSMGVSGKRKIDAVVRIDPIAYYNYPYAKKFDVCAAIGEINKYYKDSGKNLMLLSPGRIGTSSPELGVPVTFGEISNFSIICEVSESRAGYMPELSYGSHMFQDLVEADIRYNAIFGNSNTLSYNENFFRAETNIYKKICIKHPELADMIGVYETELYSWLDTLENRCICGTLPKE